MAQPQLGIAVFCEGSGPDQEGRDSIWGITDTVRMTVSGLGPLPPFEHQLLALIRVDMDSPRGRHSMRLHFEDPRGLRLPGEAVLEGELSGDEAGWRATVKVTLSAREPRRGIYRLIVEFDGARIGQIPLRLEIRRLKEGAALPAGPD